MKEAEPGKADFSDVAAKSGLVMLTQEQLNDVRVHSMGGAGIKRQVLRTGRNAKDDSVAGQRSSAYGLASGDQEDSNGQGAMSEAGALQPDNIAGLARFVSEENAQRIRNCRNILQN